MKHPLCKTHQIEYKIPLPFCSILYSVKSTHTLSYIEALSFSHTLRRFLTGERRGGGFPATRSAAEETEETLKNAQTIRPLGLSATVQLVKVGQALPGIARFQIRLTAKCYSTATYA